MLKKICETFDARDLFFAAGLGLLAAGLWQVSMSLALVASGAVLLFAALRR
jgi:hypothetical protein